MKKFYLAISLFLLAPLISNAAWWNPSTWFSSPSSDASETQILNDRITVLETEMAKNQEQASTTVPSVPSTAPVPNGATLQAKVNLLTSENQSLQSKLTLCQSNSIAVQTPEAQTTVSVSSQIIQKTGSFGNNIDTPFQYKTYVPEIISTYNKDPGTYQGWGTEILSGVVDDFLPAGDRGVTTNYIEITDGSVNSTGQKMMIEIDDAGDYSTASNQLTIGEFINIWGVGYPSQKFTSSDSVNSLYEPVIYAQRIDRCGVANCSNDSSINIFVN